MTDAPCDADTARAALPDKAIIRREKPQGKEASFAAMADEVGMRSSLVLDRLDRLAAKIVPAARSLSKEMASDWPSGIYSEIETIIKAHVATITC